VFDLNQRILLGNAVMPDFPLLAAKSDNASAAALGS